MKLSHYLIGLLLLLVFLSISIGTSDFSWGKLFALDHETWLLFQESRLPRTISILLTASSMSMAGLLMQTITQNQFAAPSTVGTTEAAKLGMVLSLFVFPSASLTQKMVFAFVSSIVIYPLLPSLYDHFYCKGKVDVASDWDHSIAELSVL